MQVSSIALGLLAVCVSMNALASVVLAARLYTRFHILRNAAWEDLAISIAWVFSLVQLGLVVLEIANGSGWPLHDHDHLTAENVIMIVKLYFINQFFYYLSLGMTKMSFLLSTYRITGRAAPGTQKICIFLMAFVVLMTVAFIMANCFLCRPIARFWIRSIPGTCVNFGWLWGLFSGFNIFTDFLILLLPLWVIWKLNLAKRQKFLLLAVVGLGLMVPAISGLRLKWVILISNENGDYLMDNVKYARWTVIETNLAMITATLPLLKPLWVKALKCLTNLAFRATALTLYTSATNISADPHAQRPPDGYHQIFVDVEITESIRDARSNSAGFESPWTSTEGIAL